MAIGTRWLNKKKQELSADHTRADRRRLSNSCNDSGFEVTLDIKYNTLPNTREWTLN